jgi:hypothetical protein
MPADGRAFCRRSTALSAEGLERLRIALSTGEERLAQAERFGSGPGYAIDAERASASLIWSHARTYQMGMLK